MTTTAHSVTYLADHTLLLAIPAFVPAAIVAGLVVFIAVRNRRRGDDETDGQGRMDD